MLLYAAIAHLMPVRANPPDQAIAQVNPAVGQLSLTLVALVYILLSVWQS